MRTVTAKYALLVCSSVAIAQPVPATQPADGRVSGTTVVAVQKSVSRLQSSLSPDRARQLETAVRAISEKHQRDAYERFVADLSGKTADEVIAIGARYMEDPDLHARAGYASQEQRLSAAQTMQQTLRAQVELYKLQHDGPPDFAKHGWKQMLSKTTARGEIDPSGQFGPYLASMPISPVRLTPAIRVVPETSQNLKPVADRETAYIYTADGRLFVIDGAGKPMGE